MESVAREKLGRLSRSKGICPKDEFSLPNINMLLGATIGHSMFSFSDGFNCYNGHSPC